MPELRPFCALRYDLSTVADAAALLCPPYDVISLAERARLARLHAHNAVHVELPQDAAGRPDYEGAARIFHVWQRRGVLRRDERASIYGYDQVYRSPDGRPARARGFFCLLRLEPFGTGVRAHERTMAGPKEDRLRLLRAVAANLSPVLLLYQDGDDGRASASLLEELMSTPPQLQADTGPGSRQRLWALEAAGSHIAEGLLRLAGRSSLTVADGHHRYETALRYRNEQRVAGAGRRGNGAPGAEWLLVLLSDAASGGLSVLPTHRLVFARREARAVLEAARELFELAPVSSSQELLDRLREPGRLGLWSAAGGALLRPRRERVVQLLPAGSEALRWLDVTVLTSALPQLVGEDAQALLDDGRLDYVKDPAEVLARAAGRERGYAFLLPSTPVPAVLEIAAAGEQMPHKSTYFEPKPASGLVFNSLLS